MCWDCVLKHLKPPRLRGGCRTAACFQGKPVRCCRRRVEFTEFVEVFTCEAFILVCPQRPLLGNANINQELTNTQEKHNLVVFFDYLICCFINCPRRYFLNYVLSQFAGFVCYLGVYLFIYFLLLFRSKKADVFLLLNSLSCPVPLRSCRSRCGLVFRRRGPAGDPGAHRGSLQKQFHPPAGPPSGRLQNVPPAGTEGGERRAPGVSLLEPAGDFCVLEPFTHPAALGGDSAPVLGLNLQLFILGIKRLKRIPSLQ